MRGMRRNVLAVLALAVVAASPQERRRLKVGVTLHSYYSWAVNIAGDAPVDIVPALRDGADVHNYQPSPEDLKRIAGLDALVVNGLGHDAFVDGMIRASRNRKLTVIRPNTGVPLIPYRRGRAHVHGKEKDKKPKGRVAYNPHTFLSLTSAVQQVYVLEKAFSRLLPDHAAAFRKNARAYARKLRRMKAEASGRLAEAAVTKVATVHDGYSYLLQEFGIEIVAVIEPAHGIQPSAKELAETIKAVREAKVRVVFSELAFPERLVDAIRRESGARVYSFDHVNRGEYAADRFENAMRANLETLVRALVADVRGDE